jgi:hypothetical protein
VPFAKVSLLRVNHYRLAPESIRAAIRAAAAGYDPGLVERHLLRITRRDA